MLLRILGACVDPVEALVFVPWSASQLPRGSQPYSEQKLELGPLLSAPCSPPPAAPLAAGKPVMIGLRYQWPLQWTMKPSRPFFSVLLPWCPFFSQMFFISQEVRQGLI